MEEKILLNIEELEERIAPHCTTPLALGGGHAAVNIDADEPILCTPNGTVTEDAPGIEGLKRAEQGGNN